MMGLASDSCTVWHKTDKGYIRSVFVNCRLEYALASEVAAVGANPDTTLKAWFFCEPALNPGDYIAPGAVDEEEPPEEAIRIRKVQPWTLLGREHHWEVEA